jgi:hypothetical protein
MKSKLRFLPDSRQLAGLFPALCTHIFDGRVRGLDLMLCFAAMLGDEFSSSTGVREDLQMGLEAGTDFQTTHPERKDTWKCRK